MRPVLTLALCLAFGGSGFAKPKLKAAAPATESSSVVQLTEAARPSIVTVTQIGRGGLHEALGTGFVIDAAGLIATNLHVIGHARRIQIQFADGSVEDVTSIHATDPSLDLAILRINRKNLKALTLGDSDQAKQGQPVVALGHPQGLQFSVVEGVISAMRDVEGSHMIQIAIPIEEGNSGGPLLDMDGRVQGILTLKSAVTENLGFAHPVNELKLLVSKPNPVPMERWLTIGRLDPKIWEPHFGGRWTQHASVIHVEDSGDGFGGRALCVAKQEAPPLPFEIAVTVKLDNEAGAAGLAFCCDGRDQHYGFYPSNGKLRLTRFNGPDVFSWTILADTAVAAYRKGGWNTLRVRVDEDKIQCFVNDVLAVEQSDAVLRGGHVGLCKFRTTRAEFKKFAVGADLGNKTVPDGLARSLREELRQYLEKPAQRDKAMEQLAAQPVASRKVLEDKARSLEEQAASLRKLQKDLHRQSIGREIASLLQRSDGQVELMRAALLVAKHDNPELDVDSYLCVTERMSEELRGDPALKQGGSAAVRRLAKYLFEENGFHGSRGDDIDNLSNSYLNEVLDDREGIPITLSIVFLELAHRLGLKDVYGVSLPGRFMVGFNEEKDGQKNALLIDPFAGGQILNRKEAEAMLFEKLGVPIDDRLFEPATTRAIILRMLYNLSSFTKKPDQTLAYLDLILAIDPGSSQDRWYRARIHAFEGDSAAARKDLEKLMEDQPREVDLEKVEALYRSL